MTRTYVAWNGETYPWPPPDGWYHAADGRWWEPGPEAATVPTEPSGFALELEASDQPTILNAGRRASDRPEPMATESDARPMTRARTSATATIDAERMAAAPSTDGPQLRPAAASGADTTAGTDTTPTDLAIVPAPPPPPNTTARQQTRPLPTVNRSQAWRARLESRRFRVVALTSLLAITALLGSIFGQALTRAATPAGETVTGTTPSATSPTADDPATTPLAPAATPTTVTTAGVPFPTPERSVQASVQRFRDLVATAGLGSDQLTDADVVDFGDQLCRAASASDAAGFEALRADLAVSALPVGTQSPDELATTVDSAILAFCPTEAARLGVSG